MSKKQESEVKQEKAQPSQAEPEEREETIDKAEPEIVDEPEELCEEEKLRLQVAKLEDKLLRSAAEFDNYKKRVARQYEDMVRLASESMLGELLEVIDNFERALNHTEEDTDFDAFREGTKLIFSQMMNLLKKYDVTPIEAIGQPFDPNLHEAMMQIESDEFDDGVVAIEVTKGYRQGQRVIRHSKVGVSSGKKDNK